MYHKAIKAGLLVGIATSAAAVASPALAQEAEAMGAGDIIVTARRVEERLQDVPISITVFDQEQLTKRNIAVATDLAAYTPSLSVDQRYGPEKASFSIRGFNQDQSTAPTVGVYFAEVVGVRAQGGTTSGNTVGAGAFTDLENVQVLKGPQGTLFGRNTTGGAILLTPKRPTNDLEGYIEGTYGNYDQVRVQGAVNLPLADTFKIRIAAERNKRDGYLKNVSGIGPKDYMDVDYTYARLSILADLTPDLENYTIFHYSDSNTNGYASKIIGCANPNSPFNPLITDRTQAGYSATRHLQAASCQDQMARQNARGDGLYQIESANPNPFLDIVQWQVINTTTWQASDTITIKNIMSYGEFRERANFDLGSSNFTVPAVDNSPYFGAGFDLTRIDPRLVFPGAPGVPIPPGTPLFAQAGAPYQRIVLDTAGPGIYNSSESTFTEELQIQGESRDGKFNFVVGGYLEFSRPIGFSGGRTAIFFDCTRPQTLECENPLIFGSISESSTQFDFDNHGIYAQGTYNFTDQLSLTLGGRYTFDKIVALTNGTRLNFGARDGYGPVFIDPQGGIPVSRACVDSYRHGPSTGAAPSLDRSDCLTVLTNKSNEPTWMVNLDYKPTPDIMLYAKYARGYRQGGINLTNPGIESWAPEKLDSFELGAKTTFRGAVPGYFNITGFYNDLSNQQVFGGLIPSAEGAAVGVSGGAGIINVGSSRAYGVEVDTSVLFFDSLRLSGGYTYLNTKIKELASQEELNARLAGTPFGQFIPRVFQGGPFNNAPKHKLTATGTYTLPLDESIGNVSFGATWVYTSKYINDATAPAMVDGFGLGVSPSTHLLNLNFDWNSIAGSPIDLSLFATNVTKEKYNVASTGAWPSAGVGEVILNQPRFYGVRLRFNFAQ